MRALVRDLLQDPVGPVPSRPSRTDVVLAAVAGVTVAIEVVAIGAWPGRALEVAIAIGIAGLLAFRRTHPFGAFAAAFGSLIVLQGIQFAIGHVTPGLGSGAFVLLLPYTLGRHARGSQVIAGVALLLGTWAANLLTGGLRSSGDAIGALVVMLLPLVVGLALRALDGGHQRDVAHAQLLERQLLARELHDTVAHHVSAITIQAQAAKAVLTRNPEAAIAALGAIENEASRALGELRALVGTLRGDEAPLQPQGGAEAIAGVVAAFGDKARFERVGEVVPLPPAVEHALHRVVGEALHNVDKHGRAVTRVDVRLETTADTVRLTITDDGEAVRSIGTGGFGVIGMRERALLVGGTLEAGPLPGRGWRVSAVLPSRAAPSRERA